MNEWEDEHNRLVKVEEAILSFIRTGYNLLNNVIKIFLRVKRVHG